MQIYIAGNTEILNAAKTRALTSNVRAIELEGKLLVFGDVEDMNTFLDEFCDSTAHKKRILMSHLKHYCDELSYHFTPEQIIEQLAKSFKEAASSKTDINIVNTLNNAINQVAMVRQLETKELTGRDA